MENKREKVIKGLAACMPVTDEDAAIGCKDCPYHCGWNYQDNDHVNLPVALIEDIRALLKAQEPRVMTLEEVRNKTPDSGPLWLEDSLKDSNGKTGWALKCAPTRKGWTTFALSNNRGTIASFNEAAYGKKWTCWTSRPTDEQRGATPWGNTRGGNL